MSQNNLYGTDKTWTAADYAIGRKMNGYWANFIKTGNPNGGSLAQWPVTEENATVQHLFEEWFETLKTY
ncbi:hypothetical protein BO83DRAFT_427136 [Aspergillus eucalypticola CBS 122712]|uniref:Carboxylesterase type B domain-containing protein n=1 Tax=Aspergillus eucalypticola (strain CBS 122712 / IBT 29274) TaxID=1448314 RepID=A0A317VKN3_ASPEC|nr:uncharacterized protein BO83DRAFT_427136 [Aspergillus eucalypticola CBS 122712]PWY73488.1 hypothetical protein BO83DRAFT_427136 [Aspergillus eucalypticola CBS 122712]